MPSLIARTVKIGARLSIKRNPRSPEALVKHLRKAMNNSPVPTLLPLGVRVGAFAEHGLRGDRITTAARPAEAILYLHGGGYVCGKTRTYHNLCGRLAKALNAEVWLPDYRLAPEHPFPAAIEDALACYELLLAQGWHASQITLAGDSAGGGLVLGTLLALRDQGRPLPKCAVVLSPFADVRSRAPSIAANDRSDAMLSRKMLEQGRNLYAPTAADENNPWASPALGDYTGLPPLLITVCEQECLRDDAYAVADRARIAGVAVSMISRPDLLHVWPIFVPVLPEAREDLQKIIRFIRSPGGR